MKKSKIILIIVLSFVVIACAVAFVICNANNMIWVIPTDSMAPTINSGDAILCKPVNNSEQLRNGDIITYRAIRQGEQDLSIGIIQSIYDLGNGQFAYEVMDCYYADSYLTTVVQHGEISGQFVGVIYNNTIGIVILLVIVLAVGVLLIRRRRNKKMLAAKQNDADSPENYAQVGVPNSAELMQYKELLDMGAITPEEFEAKKKELLGL